MSKEIIVRYLYHSGYAVQFDNILFIFDYYEDKPAGKARALSTGVIEPGEISVYKTLVFSSHRHPDHFNPVIFSWRNNIDSIKYILSSDIPKKYHGNEAAICVKPAQTINLDNGITITTLKSTDAGVAFLVEAGRITIYHAGDLNWWRWEEESKAWNNDMEARFKRELEHLKGKKIDIAFITTDPRQGADAFLGLKYFAREIGADAIFPMHFGDNYDIMERILEEQKTVPELKTVRLVLKRGEQFKLYV